MWGTISFIFKVAKQEVGLVTFLKFSALPVFLYIWGWFTDYMGWEAANPSILTSSLIIFLVLMGGLLIVIAKRAKPNFKLSLPHKGWSETPIRGSFGKATARYVRFCVEADSDVSVSNCSASIVNIQKRGPNNEDFKDVGFTDRLELEWAHSGHEKTRDLNPDEPMYIAIVSSNSRENILRFESPQELPFKYVDLLNNIATYRFVIRVTGDRVSQIFAIDVDWKGSWNTMTIDRGPGVV